MVTIEYSKVVLRKLEALKKKLCMEFGNDVASFTISHIIDTLDDLSLFPHLIKPMKDRYGVETDYNYFIISPNIFVLSVYHDKIIIKQMYNEKEDFIYKMYKIKMRNPKSVDYWGE